MAGPEQTDGKAGLPRLPPGRHGLPREFVVNNQRDRIAAGMIRAVAEHGYRDTTITAIAAAAGLSRRTFYTFYKSKEECFFATFGLIEEFVLTTMREAGGDGRGWGNRVGAEIDALLGVFSANPDLARFLLIAPPEAGGDVAAAHRQLLEHILSVLSDGRPRNVRRLSEGAEHGLIGGFAAVIADRVKDDGGGSLLDLSPDLAELFLAPYLGRAQAIRHAER